MLRAFFTSAALAAEQTQQSNTGQTIFIIGMTLLGLAALIGLALLFINIIKWGIRGIFTVLRGVLSGVFTNVKKSLIEPIAGFAYDKAQDIFYSDMGAWQRGFGYCRLYDESAALMGMIIDCEPIYFDYAGRHWLIEFWKGQYGMTTGCEVGVYNTTRPELKIPGIFYGTFYDTAGTADMLNMSYVLYKGGKALFRRAGRHWWLTGFVLGEFSEPSELTAKVSVVLKDRNMLTAFLDAMKKAGYSAGEVKVSGNSISFEYGKPRTAQPYTRTKSFESLMQKKNKFLCDSFNELTGSEKGAVAKLEAVRAINPSLYTEMIDIGGTKKILGKYKMLERFLAKTQ